MSTQRNYLVTAVVNGVNYGTFDKMEGAEVDSEELKYSPGGMGAEISLGGRQTFGNITVSRMYDLNRDHAIVDGLMAIAGKATMSVSMQPLNNERVAVGRPLTYTGTLKRVGGPDHDSMGNDVSMLELEMTTTGVVKA